MSFPCVTMDSRGREIFQLELDAWRLWNTNGMQNMNVSQFNRKPAIVVTGASGGIGRPLAKRLVSAGFYVYTCVRSADEWSAASLPAASIRPVSLDLADPASVKAAARQILSESRGALTGLVNLAGVIVDGPLELVTVADFQRQFDVNVIGPFALTSALVPGLRRGRGRVVNIGAVTARTTVPFYGPIAASKAALATINDAMRMEFAPFGIKVVLIEPGAIRTDIFAKAAAVQAAALRDQPSEIVAVYRGAMDAVRLAMSKSAADDPQVVVEAVMKALTAPNPKPRVLAGKGAGVLAVLGRLPHGIRDNLLMNSLGIARAMKASIGLKAPAATPAAPGS